MKQTILTGNPSIDKPWLKYYSEEAKLSSKIRTLIDGDVWINIDINTPTV